MLIKSNFFIVDSSLLNFIIPNIILYQLFTNFSSSFCWKNKQHFQTIGFSSHKHNRISKITLIIKYLTSFKSYRIYFFICLISENSDTYYNKNTVIFQNHRNNLVRVTGLEPVRRKTHAPQTCLSANSSTLANINFF